MSQQPQKRRFAYEASGNVLRPAPAAWAWAVSDETPTTSTEKIDGRQLVSTSGQGAKLTADSTPVLFTSRARREEIMTAIDSLLAVAKARNEKDVRQFLVENDDLVPFVKTAQQLILAFFRDDAAGIVLWVNGESIDEDAFLSIGIETSLPPREAIDRIHALDSEWLPVLDSFVREHLLVTLVMK